MSELVIPCPHYSVEFLCFQNKEEFFKIFPNRDGILIEIPTNIKSRDKQSINRLETVVRLMEARNVKVTNERLLKLHFGKRTIQEWRRNMK